MKKLVVPLLMFLLVGVISVLAHLFNLYDLWFTDIILHTVSGIAFGIAWLRFTIKDQSLWLITLGCISFATFGSVVWEYGELGAWKFIPAYAPMYSPNFFDTLGDIACGLAGGVMTGFYTLLRKR